VSDAFEKAVAAHQAGDFAAAERGYLAFRQHKNVLQNLAALYNETGRLDEADATLRLILGSFPEYAPARHSLAMTLLAKRRYAEAWPLYEARREVLGIADPAAGCPEWRGEPLHGKRLLVTPEQGVGDQIMFGRWLPELRACGVEVSIAADPRGISPLFQAAGCDVGRPGGPLPEADFWCFAGSLPLRLGAEAPAAAVWLPDFGARGGGGIGVVTRGSPTHRYDRYRSLPDEAAAELLSLGRDLQPEATGAADFRETAEIVAELDLVIAVDTSIVHLAGSMGKPCWVLLSLTGADFRWNDGVRSDWYPQLRLFRQPAPGDWNAVLAEVSRAL